MSNSMAIAAVTATLKHLLSGSASRITTQPPGRARNGETENQLNLFLYSTAGNTAFSNAPMPGQVKNGESGIPPLALVLRYLITAYGHNNNDIQGHLVMGRAMSTLHDHAVLSKAEIQEAGVQEALTGADLNEQIERVRITPAELSLDDMSKLWTSFQAEYQLSTSYDVSVVLIESTRPSRTPLPVLTRGEKDQGVYAQPDLIPPFPALSGIELPNRQPAALLGDALILKGHHLDGDAVALRFRHPRLPDPIEVPALPGGTAQQVNVQIPNDSANWMAGFYTVEAYISKAGEQARTTNVLPLPLAPRILGITPLNPVTRDGAGNVTLTLTCSPQVRPEQRAVLLLGDREILSQSHPAPVNTLDFLATGAEPGSYYVRARIDGVDSLLVDRSAEPPRFDDAMKVIIE